MCCDFTSLTLGAGINKISDFLTSMLRQGAQELISKAVQAGLSHFLDQYRDVVDNVPGCSGWVGMQVICHDRRNLKTNSGRQFWILPETRENAASLLNSGYSTRRLSYPITLRERTTEFIMKLGLISDTHIPEAMPELWPHLFEQFKGVEAILHAGDIYDLSVIDQLHDIAPVYAARGNGDDGSSGRILQPFDERLKETWLLEFNGFKIGLTHYIPMPESPPALTVGRWADKLFPSGRPDVLIYGDTHVEQVDHIDDMLCVNPGSPTFPHNLNLQFGTIGFLHLDEERPRAEIWQLNESGIVPFDWANSRRPW